MSVHYITPVLHAPVRKLCFKPYPGHPKGCPNFGKRDICPPTAPMFEDYYDMNKKFLAVVAEFDLAGHMQRMKDKHPKWSDRQCACCLYWQGTVRKALKKEVQATMLNGVLFDAGRGLLRVTDCPEAMGVDVTATMRQAGVVLEWPPRKIVRKIAFIGILKESESNDEPIFNTSYGPKAI